ncbi:MAG: diguanylate cyclase [Thermodesulfobacteriota bacterium]
MKTLLSLASEKFRTVFVIFYVLSSIMPILILMYAFFQYVRPRLNSEQLDTLMDPITYTLLAMLVIPIFGVFLMNWWIKSLERLTEDVKKKAASVLSERVEIKGRNEIVVLQKHVDGLYGELQGKISQLSEYSQQLEESKKKLAQLTTSDELTGLFNRRRFEPMLRAEIKKAEKGRYDLALAMVDVDDFKKYNQAHGHQAGDELLRNLGLLIKDYVRKAGWPFRYGGDEFAIILPKQNTESAAAMAQKLIDAAARLTIKPGPKGEPQKLSISCGVISYARNYEGLILEGDRLIQEAVAAKKGTVICLAPKVSKGA